MNKRNRISSGLLAATAGLSLLSTPVRAQFVYEGFQYGAVGDSLHGQPDDPGATDTDAIGLTGTWADATGATGNLFLKPDNLVFGDLVTKGNHVGFESNLNNDIFHRSLTSAAQTSLGGAGEIWFGILFEKLQNNFSAGEGGFALANQVVGNTRIYLNDGTDGLAGFGFGPTTAGSDLTAYAWDGTSKVTGDATISVPPANGSSNTSASNLGDVRLIVGHISFDTGTGGTDVYTFYDYALNGGTVDGGTLNQVASPLEVDVDQTALDVVNLTRQVNLNYDELRIGTTLAEVVPFLNYAAWAARFPGADLSDPGADFESDGLTNQQEFDLQTDPTKRDSDGDGLEDGPEVAGAGARPPTDPTERDTDGDGLWDGVESNTGTWVSASDTGTNPIAVDSDLDGLADGVETNTDTFLSETNTGTDPTDIDSDGDGTGDWYEIVSTGTDPTDAGDDPGIPYPLPDPDGSTGATDKPVKVYILSGQSNMVGFGRVGGDEAGTLETISKVGNKFPNLVDGGGAWIERNDVLYHGVVSALGKGGLRPGFGANGSSFGPELGFGHVMGWFHDEPVLLIKSSIGSRSIGWDCLPPGSAQFEYNSGGTDYTYAGYGDNPSRWETGTTPIPGGWYAGKSFDTFFVDEDDMGPLLTWADATFFPNKCFIRYNGIGYRSKSDHTSSPVSEPGVGGDWATYWELRSDFNVVDILDNFAGEYPDFAAQGFEIAGYVWWQGYNDQGNPYADRYEFNMVNFIKKVREYYETRYPANTVRDAPFVLATLATGGWNLSGNGLTVAEGQLAVSGETGNYPEFAGNVKTIEARSYWRDFGPNTNQGYHYNHNAETYMLVGDALGWGMVELLEGASTAPPLITSITVNGGTVTMVMTGKAGTTYTCKSSTDLTGFPTTETPISGSLTTDDNGDATFSVNASPAAVFYRVEE